MRVNKFLPFFSVAFYVSAIWICSSSANEDSSVLADVASNMLRNRYARVAMTYMPYGEQVKTALQKMTYEQGPLAEASSKIGSNIMRMVQKNQMMVREMFDFIRGTFFYYIVSMFM